MLRAANLERTAVASGRRRAIYSIALTITSHVSKIAVGFAFLKLMAIYLGAEGMGQLGNLMSAVTFLSLLAGGGIVNGVIKYVAEYKEQPRKLFEFLVVAKTYSILFCSVVFVLGVLFSFDISNLIFKHDRYYWIIVFLMIAQFGFAFTNLVTGTANGLSSTKTYATIQVTGNCLVLPVAWFLIYKYGVPGAAISMVLFFLLYAMPAFYFYRISIFYKRVVGLKINKEGFKKLLTYSLMAIVGALSVPLVEIVVRESIIAHVGYAAAGIWQASIKLSAAYMGFFIVFLAVYFMPMISAQKNKTVIGESVLKFIKVVMCLFSVGGVLFYFLRQLLIPLLLSSEFYDLESLIQYQLIGDFFRIATYVIGFVAIAKAALKIYLISEISQGVVFCGLSLLLMNSGLGLKVVFLANLIMNVIYFTCSVIGFVVYLKKTGEVHVIS